MNTLELKETENYEEPEYGKNQAEEVNEIQSEQMEQSKEREQIDNSEEVVSRQQEEEQKENFKDTNNNDNNCDEETSGGTNSIETEAINNEYKPMLADDECEYVAIYKLDDFIEDSRSTLKDYICHLCKGVFFKPVTDNCGHTYCRPCIEKYLSLNHNRCPLDQSQIVTNLINISFIQNFVEKHTLYCCNRNDGCTWTGSCILIVDHINNDCPKQRVRCINEGCKEIFTRENFGKHAEICMYKILICEYCGCKITKINVDKHLEVCAKYPITCTLCGDEIIRENLNWHLTEKCTERAIECPYEFCGCLFRVKRREMEDHVCTSVKAHLDLFTSYHKKSEEQKSEKIESMINSMVTTTIKKILSNPTNVSKMFNLNLLKEMILESMQGSTGNNSGNNDMLNRKRDNSQIVLDSNVPQTKKTSGTNGINVLQNESLLCEIDQNYCSPGIVKLERLVAVNDNPQPLDKFVLTNLNLKNFGKTFKWKVKMTKLTKWCAVGLGIKEVIKDNNYKYGIADSKHKGKLNNGCYVICSNGYICNTNNYNENMLRESYIITEGCEIIMIYEPKNQTLEFSIPSQKYKFTMTNVGVEGSKQLVPIVVVFNRGDMVNFDFLS